MFEKFTDGARRAVVLSSDEAQLLDHDYIAVEHLFLGALGAGASASDLLGAHGVTLQRARQEAQRTLGRRASAGTRQLPFTASAKHALEASLRESLELNHPQITSSHLMLGILAAGAEVPEVQSFFDALDIDVPSLRAELSVGAGADDTPGPVGAQVGGMPEPDVRILAEGLQFPEGPIAMADGSVLLVEARRGTLSRVSPDGSVDIVAELGGGPNGAAIGPDGAVYVVNNGGFLWTEMGSLILPLELGTGATEPPGFSGGWVERVDLGSGEVTRLYEECDGDRLTGPNDIVFDAEGGFWFTDHGKIRRRDQDRGALYYALPDGSRIEQKAFPLLGPNGVGLSPEGGRVYVAETYTGRLLAWDLAAPGQLASPAGMGHGGEVVAATPDHFDSLAVEDGGNVVVAAITHGLAVITPAGDVSHTEIPDPIVTNVCFSGSTAYVTLSGNGALGQLEWPRPGLELAFSA